jgi:hypothetical protein
MMINDRDLDALRRALLWGQGYQKCQPQLKLFPDVMPAEGTEAWLALALQLAALAQSHTLGLRPWQVPPIDVDDDAVADPDGWGCKPEEIALRRTMRELNVSIYEPDVPTAIANAAHQRACHVQRPQPHRRSRRDASHKGRRAATQGNK